MDVEIACVAPTRSARNEGAVRDDRDQGQFRDGSMKDGGEPEAGSLSANTGLGVEGMNRTRFAG